MNDSATIEHAATLRGKLVDYLSLERNVSLGSLIAPVTGGLLIGSSGVIVAGVIGLIGAVVFALTVEEKYAS